MLIREAEQGDEAQLENIFFVSRAKYFTWENPKNFKLGDYQKSTRGEKVFVAEINRKIVGFISVWEEDSFIHHLFVAPDHQGKGIGKQLLKKVVTTLPLPMTLKVVTYNTKAVNFYQKQGWAKLRTHQEDSPPYHLYIYNRSI